MLRYMRLTLHAPRCMWLQALPADFQTTLEEYVRDMPKTLDPAGSVSGRKAGAQHQGAAVRSSTIARQGGTTSSAIAGGHASLQIAG